MAKENYDATIDQKLSELYEVLKELNTLKEKTSAVQQVVEGLSEAGKSRVAEIDAAVGRLGNGINKSIEIVRDFFTQYTSDAKAAIDESVAKVADAVSTAGRERIDSMKTTADTFSATVAGLVEGANEGTSRMTEIVAELRGLPIVEELHSLKASNEKVFGEIKRIGDAVATIDGILSSVAEVRKNIEDKVDSLAKSISQGIVVAVDDLKREINSLGQDISDDQRKKFSSIEKKLSTLDELSGKILSETAAGLLNLSEKLGDISTDISKESEKIEIKLRDVKNDLTIASAENTEKLSAENKGLSEKQSEIDSKIDQLTKATNDGFSAERHKISVGTFVIGVMLFLIGIALLPIIISGWKTFVGL